MKHLLNNLENFQGDERDVGCGKDKHGQISYNFRSLNRPGGERRFSVVVIGI
ncbi:MULTISPECIES: hypothetical protein [Paenibacillus]|uniref:hypothetical protein n=1 Tax=Paenibacillus TaxID=44249 RepID=UPI0015C3DE41|nr:hypothetical protein [Paenibacillus odorifer]